MSAIKRIIFGAFSIGTYALGAMMNKAVMLINHGMMPVVSNDCVNGMKIDSTHFCAESSTNLKPLMDWIPLGDYIYSPGDFVLYIGYFLLVLFLITSTYAAFRRMDKWLT